jgi:hypothetical protein
MNPSIRDATVVWRRALRALVEQTGGMIALDTIQGDAREERTKSRQRIAHYRSSCPACPVIMRASSKEDVDVRNEARPRQKMNHLHAGRRARRGSLLLRSSSLESAAPFTSIIVHRRAFLDRNYTHRRTCTLIYSRTHRSPHNSSSARNEPMAALVCRRTPA